MSQRNHQVVLVVADSAAARARSAARLAGVDGCRVETASPRAAATALPDADAAVVVGIEEGDPYGLSEAAGHGVEVATVPADGRTEGEREGWLGAVVDRLARLARYDDQRRRAFDAARRAAAGSVTGSDASAVDTPADDLRSRLEPADYEALFHEFAAESDASTAT